MKITFFMNHLDKVPICEHGLAQGYCPKCEGCENSYENSEKILPKMLGSNEPKIPDNILPKISDK